MASTHLSVRIDLANRENIGPDKIALLEAIQARGSISGAARLLSMSRRGAWLWVQSINKALREPAVATEVGGAKHGGARLTPVGARMVKLFHAIEARAQAAALAELR
jgi:molybdate transport system regulatory protein